jgi:crotonobetainyl-CoA:carnitine CoA-transferase CaiB-like acyl-CoA transferase
MIVWFIGSNVGVVILSSWSTLVSPDNTERRCPTWLADIEVLEISSRMSGAYCGRLLRALGADVTRVELPLVAYAHPEVRSALELTLQEGKSSVDAADDAAARLAASADVVVVDVLHDDPLDGAATAIAQKLLAARGRHRPVIDIAQFGSCEGGPARPGAPLATGAASAASWSIGDPAREPLSLPFDIADIVAGVEAAAAAALVLVQRDALRSPAQVQIASSDVLAYYVSMIAANFVPYDRPWHRDGPQASQSGGSYPAAIFSCRDGAVAIMCRQSREWTALLAAMGDPPWSSAPERRDARLVARRHAAEVDPLVRAWVRRHSLDELVALSSEYGFPLAKIRSVAEPLTDPQYVHRAFFHDLVVPERREPLRVPGAPYRIAATTSAAGPRSSTGVASAPLAGLRVLDFTWVWSGPMVTGALSDLGAEVLKIEHESRPDSARARGGAIRNGRMIEGPELELSNYFNAVNRGKRSVGVNLTTSEGRDLVRRLAGVCDVVVENMRPGALARRGLGYDDLRRENPGLVMVSMSMAGATGPDATMAGYAPVMSGLAGLEALVAYEDSEPMGLFNLAFGDANAAAHALGALLAAVRHQRRTGEGCLIDLSQMECVSSILIEPLLEAQITGFATVPANRHTTFFPHGHVRCAGEDAWLAIAVRTANERHRLAALLEVDPDDASAVMTALQAWALERDPEAAAAELTARGLAASPLQSFEKMQEVHRAGWTLVQHPYIGEQLIGGLPWRIDGERAEPQGRAPLLGEHTDMVLCEFLEMDADEIDALRAIGALSPSPAEPITSDGVL